MGEERLGNGVTGYRFGSEVLNIPVWERMKEGETHYWNFRCPEILRLKLRGKIGKRRKINPTARTGLIYLFNSWASIDHKSHPMTRNPPHDCYSNGEEKGRGHIKIFFKWFPQAPPQFQN